MNWYALITVGTPSMRVSRVARGTEGLHKLATAAEAARGTGNCTHAFVVQCPTRDVARNAKMHRNLPVIHLRRTIPV